LLTGRKAPIGERAEGKHPGDETIDDPTGERR
jgi:hypothetical protein